MSKNKCWKRKKENKRLDFEKCRNDLFKRKQTSFSPTKYLRKAKQKRDSFIQNVLTKRNEERDNNKIEVKKINSGDLSYNASNSVSGNERLDTFSDANTKVVQKIKPPSKKQEIFLEAWRKNNVVYIRK